MTICSDCKHRRERKGLPNAPACYASRLKFIDYGIDTEMQFRSCELVNVGGNCSLFEAKTAIPKQTPDWAEREGQVSWWRRLFA